MSSIALKPFDVQSSVGYHSQPLFVLVVVAPSSPMRLPVWPQWGVRLGSALVWGPWALAGP